MDNVSMLREQFKNAHQFLEMSMQDVTEAQAHWAPPGNANPLGATYAHAVLGEDMILNMMVKGGAPPLFATGFAGKAGVSEPPPAPDQGSWDQWARKVKVDLPAAREYAKAVYAATDEYLASLDGNGLAREIDLSAFHMGTQSVGWFAGNVLLSHISCHWGEVACLKGLQGAKGYPF